jgi:rhamnosyltransferase
MKFGIVIPIYFPGQRLQTLLDLIAELQVPLVIVDDGPQTDLSGFRLNHRPELIRIVSMETNKGIAAALNFGIRVLNEVWKDLDYVLTCDQDSFMSSTTFWEFISRAKTYNSGDWGCYGPGHIGPMQYKSYNSDEPQEVTEIIQSFALFKLAALEQADYFLEPLVIDCVDTEICHRLTSLNFKVIADPQIAINHQIGSGQFIDAFNYRIANFKHNPYRRFFIVRNGIALIRRYYRVNRPWAFLATRRLLVSSLISLVSGPQRIQQMKAIARGTKAAWTFNIR